MNPLRQLRYKTRVGLLLGGLLVVLLLNNMASRESYDAMQKTAQSFYEDRLMPSTFIFELREHLDQERILFAARPQDEHTLQQQQVHQQAIAGIIRKYEQTSLTPEERREWQRFKLHLNNFQQHRATAGGNSADYAQSLAALNHLSLIQAGEGKHLQADMNAIVQASSLRSYLEVALIIAIGCITLFLIGYSRNMFEQAPTHRPSMN